MPGMNEQHERALIDGLKALAGTTRQAAASPHIEAAVLARMAATTAKTRVGVARRPSAGGRWYTLAAAAALVLASVSGAWLAHRTEPPGPAMIRPLGFVEIPDAGMLPPLESGSIIRVALPVGALPQYGLAIPAYAFDGHVDADLLVAQDGVPRAIRLVQDESTRSTP
jgi:hypothetical protein